MEPSKTSSRIPSKRSFQASEWPVLASTQGEWTRTFADQQALIGQKQWIRTPRLTFTCPLQDLSRPCVVTNAKDVRLPRNSPSNQGRRWPHRCEMQPPLNQVTNNGQSPLRTAAWTGNLHAIRRLLHQAPELAWRHNSQRMTPLERIEYLIENPASHRRPLDEVERQNTRCGTRDKLLAAVSSLERHNQNLTNGRKL